MIPLPDGKAGVALVIRCGPVVAQVTGMSPDEADQVGLSLSERLAETAGMARRTNMGLHVAQPGQSLPPINGGAFPPMPRGGS